MTSRTVPEAPRKTEPGTRLAPASSRSPDPLEIATRAYYSRPAKAYFSWIELEEYRALGRRFSQPLLDLGSGDGTFGRMLEELGVVTAVDISLDHSLGRLAAATRSGRGPALVADIKALPLRSGSIGSILCNAVLGSMPVDGDEDLGRASGELLRVLASQGTVVLTAPTPRFVENLGPHRLLRSLGLRRLADGYGERISRRMAHYSVLGERVWRERTQEAGFAIEEVRHFFSPRDGRLFGILTNQLFRVFGLSRVLLKSVWRRILPPLWRLLFRAWAARRRRDRGLDWSSLSGFVMLVGRRMSRP